MRVGLVAQAQLAGGAFLASKDSHVASSFLAQSQAPNISLPILRFDGDRLKTEFINTTDVQPAQQMVGDPAKLAPYCSKSRTVFDIGLHDATDATNYLSNGYCVVGLEADPDLVHDAAVKLQAYVKAGVFRIVHTALALSSGAAKTSTTFYRSKCTKEWNSFLKVVGCRDCHPPNKVNPDACVETQLVTSSCADLVEHFGTPLYMKLDVEGAEGNCFEALYNHDLPSYVSAEITSTAYLDDLFRMGYNAFKLVRQDQLVSHGSSSTGPFGDGANDCRSGHHWRNFSSVLSDLAFASTAQFNRTDPCPGGMVDVTTQGAGHIWYDIHAKIVPEEEKK